jgi:two-component system OmpR family sensor kinase/two-component system sensor histidine kinase QseC
LAGAAALRVVVPLILLLPVMVAFVAWIVGQGLRPLKTVTAEVQRRDVRSLSPLEAKHLPQEIEPLVSELNRLLQRLELAFSAQRDFVADAAHELRSPLTALRLQLQLMDRAPDEAARLEARERLGSAIERAIHLAEQLLTLARADPGPAVAVAESVDLSAIAATAIADSHALASTRQIDVSLEAEPMAIRGDAEGLRILVRNLLDNAVRYTPAGGTVRVQCFLGNEGPELDVQDSGPGIPDAEKYRVFDRFYRRTGVRETGSGLGLAIVKAVAHRHSAKVMLDDAPGGGLLVRVRFPTPA